MPLALRAEAPASERMPVWPDTFASRVAVLIVALAEEPESSLSLEDEPLDCDSSRLL